MTPEDAPVAGMTNFGWSPTTETVDRTCGMAGGYPATHPPGHRSRVRLLLGDAVHGKWVEIGWLYYGPDGKFDRADLTDLVVAVTRRLIPEDRRVVAFVTRFAGGLATLAAADHARQFPAQFPFLARIVVRPGDAEVLQ